MSSPYNLRSRTTPKKDDSYEDIPVTQKREETEKLQRRRSPTTDSDSDDSTDGVMDSSQTLLQDSSSDLEIDSGSSFNYEHKYSSPPSTTGSPSALTPSPRLSHRNTQRSHSSPLGLNITCPSLASRPNERDSPSTAGSLFVLSPPKYVSPIISPIKDDENNSPKTQHGYSPSGIYIVFIVLLAIVSLILMGYILYPEDKPTHKSPRIEFKEYVNRVNKLRGFFPSQDERTWKTLKSSVRHILDGKNPNYPAVILFAVPMNTSKLGTCLAQQTAQRFSNSSELKAYIDCQLSNHLDSDAEKLDLDEKIHAHLKTGKAVVIDHIEKLSPTAALLFHGICDNDNAPFKDVLITLVFHLDIPLDINPKDVEVKVKEYLNRELDMDKVGAMLSRIANNIIVVRQEKIQIKICP